MAATLQGMAASEALPAEELAASLAHVAGQIQVLSMVAVFKTHV